MNGFRSYCTFEVDRLLFGVDVDHVLEVIRQPEPTRVPHASTVVLGLINLRGQIVTMLDLRERLEMDPNPTTQRPMAVVLRDPGGPIALVVDAIGDVLEVEPSQLEPSPETLPEAVKQVLRGQYPRPERSLLVLEVTRVLEVSR